MSLRYRLMVGPHPAIVCHVVTPPCSILSPPATFNRAAGAFLFTPTSETFLMPELTAPVHPIECQVMASWLSLDLAGLVECSIIAVTSVPGQVLSFTALFRDGSVYGRLPIMAFRAPGFKALDVYGEDPCVCQVWDNPSAYFAVVKHTMLATREARLSIPGRPVMKGEYLFTVDYYGAPGAEGAGEWGWKPAHLFWAENGRLVALPNNKVAWPVKAYVDELWSLENPPKYRPQPRVYSAEEQGL